MVINTSVLYESGKSKQEIFAGFFLFLRCYLWRIFDLSMVVEKQNDNCFFFPFFFWYNVFLAIGKCRFSDCVTHNLVISRFDGLSLVDFRFNSLNRNSVFTLYINHEKYTTKSTCVITLTTTAFSYFF